MRLQINQRSPNWHQQRRMRITASNFSAVLGINPFMSRSEYMNEMVSPEPPKREFNNAMKWGVKNEPKAIVKYRQVVDKTVDKGGFWIHPHFPFIAGSPDGLISTDGCIEVKCPYRRLEPHNSVPEYYLPQIKGIMEICGRDYCDFFSYIPEHQRLDPNAPNYRKQSSSIASKKLNAPQKPESPVIVDDTDNRWLIPKYRRFGGMCRYDRENGSLWVPEQFVRVRVQRDRDYWHQILLPSLTEFYNEMVEKKLENENKLEKMKNSI